MGTRTQLADLSCPVVSRLQDPLSGTRKIGHLHVVHTLTCKALNNSVLGNNSMTELGIEPRTFCSVCNGIDIPETSEQCDYPPD